MTMLPKSSGHRILDMGTLIINHDHSLHIQTAPRPMLLVYHEAWLASSIWTTAKNNGPSMTSPSFSSRRRQKFSLCLHGRSIHAIAHRSLAVATQTVTMCNLCRNDH
jgi:hypothetical protein